MATDHEEQDEGEGTVRRNFTLSRRADRVLDELAAGDVAGTGRTPNRSATLIRLIIEEQARKEPAPRGRRPR